MILGFVSFFFVMAGACLLVAGLSYTRKIVTDLPDASISWRAMFLLIIFFLVGYIIFAAQIFGHSGTTLTTIVSLVFLGGGCFVLTVTSLSERTIRRVKQLTVLETENIEIRAMKRRLETILNTAAEGIITFDGSGSIEGLNHAAEELFGYTEEEAMGKPIGLLIQAENGRNQQEHTPDLMRNTLTTMASSGCEIHGVRRNGEIFPMKIKVGTTLLEGKQYYTAVVADITARKRAEEALNFAFAEINQIFNSAADGMALIDTEFIVVRANDTFIQMAGIPKEKVLGQKCYEVFPGLSCNTLNCPLSRILGGEKRMELESVKTRQDGTKIPCIVTATRFLDADGKIVGIIEDFKDITDRKKLEEKLRELSITDELTCLFNRRGFFTMAEKHLKLAERDKVDSYLLYIDIDNMKRINDQLGHHVGDQALIKTADVLRHTFRESDIIGRLGGDEFAVLITERSGTSDEQSVITRLEENFHAINAQKDREYDLLISTGIVRYDLESPCSLDDLMSRADSLMYECKNRKKNAHIESYHD